MTTLVSELYQALLKAGVDDATAQAAAKSVIGIEDKAQLATKADVAELRLATKADVAELKADLTRSMFNTMLAMTALFSAISAALRFV